MVYSVLEPMFYFTASQFDVDVYDDAQVGYYVFPAGQTVTWSVADESIATVDESGTVTGVSLGRSTLTATLSNGTTKSCYVYVTVADGVYYVRNAVSGHSITISDSAANVTAAYIDNYRNSASTTRAFQLWKIAYVSTGMYVIRPMSRTASVLTVNESGDVIVKDLPIGIEDSDVPIMNRWEIKHDSSGYTFHYKGLSSATIRPAGTATNPKTKVITAALSSAPDFRWVLSSAEPAMLRRISTTQAVTVATEIPIELGDSANLRDLDLELEHVKPPTTTVWTSSNSAVVQVNQSTGAVRGLSRGKAVITMDMIIGNIRYTQSYTLIVRETIYVKNFYDSTLANDTATIQCINKAVNFLNIVYEGQFFLHFENAGEAQLYSDSFFDECTHKLSSACTTFDCGVECISHHKNISRIGNALYEEWAKNHVVVMWRNTSPEYFCGSTSDNGVSQHTFLSWDTLGLTLYRDPTTQEDWLPVIQIFSIPKTSDNDTIKVSVDLILAHEIAHTLGYEDVYDYSYHDDDAINDHYPRQNSAYTCIMCTLDINKAKGVYPEIKDFESAFCVYCAPRISEVIPANAYES